MAHQMAELGVVGIEIEFSYNQIILFLLGRIEILIQNCQLSYYKIVFLPIFT